MRAVPAGKETIWTHLLRRRPCLLYTSIINELIVPDVLYSSMIGLRYLNDVLRDFYVPSTLDSGVKLIAREELADESH